MRYQAVQQCEPCWEEENPDLLPFKLNEEFLEQTVCVTCNHMTRSGIYVRKDVSNAKGTIQSIF